MCLSRLRLWLYFATLNLEQTFWRASCGHKMETYFKIDRECNQNIFKNYQKMAIDSIYCTWNTSYMICNASWKIKWKFESSIIDNLKKQEKQLKFTDLFTRDHHKLLSGLFVKLKTNTAFFIWIKIISVITFISTTVIIFIFFKK